MATRKKRTKSKRASRKVKRTKTDKPSMTDQLKVARKRRLGQLRYTNGYCTKACRRVFATLARNCRMEALPTMNGLVSESATCSQRMKVSRCHTTTVDPWHVWIVRYNCSMPSHIPGFG